MQPAGKRPAAPGSEAREEIARMARKQARTKPDEQQAPARSPLKMLQELAALQEISRSLQVLDLDEILHLVLDGVTKTIGFDRARLYLINEREHRLECRMAAGIEQEKTAGVTLPLEKSNSMLARSVIERKPFIVEDAMEDPRVNRDLKQLFGLKSFAVVPLVGRGRVLGAITADNLTSDRVITPEGFNSLVAFAGQAGVALENAQVHDELRTLNRELEQRVRDATEDLKKTQDKLIQSEKLAALGKLSAGIAHEIRNPLTSMKVLVHALSGRLEGREKEQEDIAVIEDEIERVNRIITRFLDFARPRSPEFSRVDVNRLLDETITLVTREAEERGVLFEQTRESVPAVLADREQMKQVFLNVFLNALDAMPGGGQLSVSTRCTAGRVEIAVSDRGGGIQEETRKQIFEPFFTTKEEGVGLGLSIVKRIVDEHGGTLLVKDNPPRGTTFTVSMPPAGSEGALA